MVVDGFGPKRAQLVPEFRKGADVLVELSQLVLDNGEDVRTRSHALSPQREDVTDLIERETNGLRLEDEAQAIAVRGTVDAVPG
jgi:hypothetical protein